MMAASYKHTEGRGSGTGIVPAKLKHRNSLVKSRDKRNESRDKRDMRKKRKETY